MSYTRKPFSPSEIAAATEAAIADLRTKLTAATERAEKADEIAEVLRDEMKKIALALGRSKTDGETDCDWAFLSESVAGMVARAEKAELEAECLDFVLNEGGPDSILIESTRLRARVAALEEVAEAFEHEAAMRRRDFAVTDRGTELNCLTRNGALEYGRVQMLEKCAANVRAALSTAPAPSQVEYRPGHWFEPKSIDEMQAFFTSRVPAIREAAREYGYAIGLHGSMRRDLDLIAVPWRDGAADKDNLAHAISMAACGLAREGRKYQWEAKPAGRIATSLPLCWTDHDNPEFGDVPGMGHIDLSVMPAPSQATAERKTFEVPPGYIPVRDLEGRCTGEVIPEWRATAVSNEQYGKNGEVTDRPMFKRELGDALRRASEDADTSAVTRRELGEGEG